MKAVLQRVLDASVLVDGAPHASIGKGIVVLLGVSRGDTDADAETLARKTAGLRVFDDADGRMNLSNGDIGGEWLVVSQFTLCADLGKGKRPSFEPAMKPPEAERLYRLFCERLKALGGRPVHTGSFGASMTVELRNDGPVTFILDSPAKSPEGSGGKSPEGTGPGA